MYSKNPNVLFTSLVEQDLIQIHASKLWLVPLAVSEHICYKLALQDIVHVPPRWPAKLIVQCLEDSLYESPSKCFAGSEIYLNVEKIEDYQRKISE